MRMGWIKDLSIPPSSFRRKSLRLDGVVRVLQSIELLGASGLQGFCSDQAEMEWSGFSSRKYGASKTKTEWSRKKGQRLRVRAFLSGVVEELARMADQDSSLDETLL